jgi:hypothetical protein
MFDAARQSPPSDSHARSCAGRPDAVTSRRRQPPGDRRLIWAAGSGCRGQPVPKRSGRRIEFETRDLGSTIDSGRPTGPGAPQSSAGRSSNDRAADESRAFSGCHGRSDGIDPRAGIGAEGRCASLPSQARGGEADQKPTRATTENASCFGILRLAMPLHRLQEEMGTIRAGRFQIL